MRGYRDDQPPRPRQMDLFKSNQPDGAIGAPAAIMNAVHDALSAVGVTRIDMPASPHRVWQAIQSAKA